MYLHVYKNNPSARGCDGNLVSEGSGNNPIVTPLLIAANNEESSGIALALRCAEGYKTSGNTILTPVGTAAAKWALSSDGIAWQAYGTALTISTEIGAVNTIFYMKAKAMKDEFPSSDSSVVLQVTGQVEAI